MPKRHLTGSQRELAKFGYLLEPTGGNCTALIHTEPHADDCQEWVMTSITSAENELSAPERMGEIVLVAECPVGPDGYHGEPEYTNGYTLADVITALNAKGDEYTLLSLRLANYVR